MTSAHATLAYVGRSLWLAPATLGKLFEDDCTVPLTRSEAPCLENKWKRRTVPDPQREFWYQDHPVLGQKVFCTHSGFGPRIQEALQKRGITVNVEDHVDHGLGEPVFKDLVGLNYRGTQREVLAAILAHRGGIVSCPTGWGKSWIIRLVTKAYPRASIVVTVPVIEIARELYEALASNSSDVGMVGDGKHNNGQRVTVAVSHSLMNCNRNCSILLADEAHALCSSSFRNSLVQFPRAKMFGFTATDEGRHDNGDAYLEAIFGPVIAKVPYQEAVDSGNVVPITVFYYEVMSGPDVSRIERLDLKERAGIWANAQRNAYAQRAVAFALRHAQEELGTDNPQILIMVDKVEHALRLQQLLPDFALVHGDLNDDDRIEALTLSGALAPGQKLCSPKDRKALKQAFTDGTLRRVISNKVWSKGVNFPDLNYLIRMDGSGSDIHSGQIPGRLSRLGSGGDKGRGFLIDFKDKFSRDLANRSEKRFATYRRNGFQTKKIA